MTWLVLSQTRTIKLSTCRALNLLESVMWGIRSKYSFDFPFSSFSTERISCIKWAMQSRFGKVSPNSLRTQMPTSMHSCWWSSWLNAYIFVLQNKMVGKECKQGHLQKIQIIVFIDRKLTCMLAACPPRFGRVERLAPEARTFLRSDLDTWSSLPQHNTMPKSNRIALDQSSIFLDPAA